MAWLWKNVAQENMHREILQRHLDVVGRIIAQADDDGMGLRGDVWN